MGLISFVELNVWLDIIFTAMWFGVVIFLLLHFTLYITTGRFKKNFIEGNWPHHDARPPATPKWLHFVHLFSMIMLGFSGMYLRFPFFQSNRIVMRNIHYVFMIIVIVILVWRVWYAFFSKTNADWREFAIGKKDLQSALGVIKYYGYMSNDKPHVAKYNVMQKMSYNLFLVLMFVQAFTGLFIWRFQIPVTLFNVNSLYGVTAAILGGNGVWGVRTVHYIINWLFIIMTTVHFYLAATADLPCALDFFGVKEMDVYPDEGHHDDGGHAAPTLPEPEPQVI
jgi:Ni/Fe-hydrogenase 1 B-type cytochrome subunit